MRNSFEKFVTRMQASPYKLVGFGLGLFVPLTLVAIFWAQTSGGLAGPLVDPRPPAFIVQTD